MPLVSLLLMALAADIPITFLLLRAGMVCNIRTPLMMEGGRTSDFHKAVHP